MVIFIATNPNVVTSILTREISSYQPASGVLDFSAARQLKEQYSSVVPRREDLESLLAAPVNEAGLGGERYQCAEALFNPLLVGQDETLGLHEVRLTTHFRRA